MFSLQAWSCQQPCGKLLLCKQHKCSQPCHTGTHTVSHTHTESCVKLHCDSTQSRVSCPKCPPESPPSPVCVRVRALSQSQRSEVCVRQREGREALRQPPLDLPAGVFAVCQQQRTAGFVIVYCQNLQMFQMFQTRCSVWSLLAGSESVT